MKCYVQLSKIGDIISILPILYNQFLVTNEKTALMVCRDFASVLEGVTYVEPVLFNGAYDDLKKAVAQAKRVFSQVVVLQTHGNIPIHRTTPSFQLDQWKRAGVADHFNDWPTVFDRRDEATKVLDMNGKPYILFGDHSQSSPFLHKEELATMLKTSFPGHEVVRLSEHRTPRIFDFLPLYDGAAALVTVETAHLHLSKASKVPTFALAANGWRGSAWHQKFAFYMRYAEWERRKAELIEAVKTTVGGNKLQRFAVHKFAAAHHGYNMSVIHHKGERIYSFRAHNGSWRTKIFLVRGNSSVVELKVCNNQNHSIEDMRLLEWRGQLYGSYVVATEIDGTWRCYTAYGRIDDDTVEHIQPVYGGNDFRSMNKNWTPFVYDDTIHFIYGSRNGQQIVLRVDGNKVQAEYASPAPAWAWGTVRGGAIVPFGERMLRFFHSRQDYPDRNIRYFIGASIIENKPPFKTIAVSQKPILQGDERWKDAPYWKANVVFPCGAIIENGKILLSFGRNDSECCVSELTEKDLNL